MISDKNYMFSIRANCSWKMIVDVFFIIRLLHFITYMYNLLKSTLDRISLAFWISNSF
jgi:hypothetical protein